MRYSNTLNNTLSPLLFHPNLLPVNLLHPWHYKSWINAFQFRPAFAMVVTLIIDISTSSFAVDIQLSHNFYFAGVVSETQNRWLFEVWGPAGMLLEQELAEGWKVEGIAPMTQDEHYWGWGQTPAPHHLCAPLQSSASLLCSRQPAHKCLRLVHTALETPWSEGNMTLLHPHRCSSSSTCPSSAVCSGMRMRRFWPLSHLKCFAPQMGAESKR